MKNISLILLLSVFASCAKEKPKEAIPFPVKVAPVTQKNIPYYLKGIGHLVASNEVLIRPQSPGILKETHFCEGDLVEAGDLLLSIDSRIYEAELERALGSLKEHQARHAYAMDMEKRMAPLLGDEYISEAEYQEHIQKIAIARGGIQSAIGSIKKAETELDFTQVHSPIRGYVGHLHADPGNYVSLSDHHALLTIRQITPIHVEFSLPSLYLEEIRQKQALSPLLLKAERPADTTHPLVGHLNFIDNRVNPNTGMIMMKGEIPNEDERGWPGEFVRIYILIDTIANATIVPSEALVVGQDATYVFVVKEGKVEMRNVGRGIEHERETIINWGLEPGETIVVDGQAYLYPEAPVYVPNLNFGLSSSDLEKFAQENWGFSHEGNSPRPFPSQENRRAPSTLPKEEVVTSKPQVPKEVS